MRFFHKFGSINYDYLGLVNGFLLKAKQKTKYTHAVKYLKKYEYAIDNYEKIKTSDKYPNKIWQCWFQGKENMPLIVKKCTESVKKYHGEDVIFLDSKNILDYIELPDYILEKHKKGIIPFANFSDICRLSLLAKYGGTWVDSTIFLTGEIPQDIFKADFFSYSSIYCSLLKYMDSVDDFCTYSNDFKHIIPIESPYFIHSKAGNEIINGVLSLMLEYWKYENSLYDYLLIDKFFIITVLHNKELKEQFLKEPMYYCENVLLLQHALFEKYNEKLFNQIKRATSVHKLTHKNLYRNPYKDSFFNFLLKF